MSNASFSPDGKEASRDPDDIDQKSRFISPEFILIDDRNGKEQYTYFNSDPSYKHPQPSSVKDSTSLRFICLLGLIFCSLFGLGVFFTLSIFYMLCYTFFI